MITFKCGGKAVVLALCFDKAAQKYRLVNIGERTIASQLYEKAGDALLALRDLEKKGRIKELTVFDEL